MRDYYKYRCNFNASHSFDGNRDNEHQHTFTLVLYIRAAKAGDMDFDEVKGAVDRELARYEGAYLNGLVEFADGASVEAVGDFLFLDMKDKLVSLGLELMRLDIGDNPLSMYQVGRILSSR